jgi:VIT1/CCC1 family predicted Fe2+/Mn2+ transporter
MIAETRDAAACAQVDAAGRQRRRIAAMAQRVESHPAAKGAPGHVPVEHHRRVTGGTARAAIFGISDGLLTNIALILGVAGANPAPGVVRLAGIAGLVGGAFSMGAGEYVSMSAQTELIQRELDLERRELERHPESERRELAGIYTNRGVPRDVANEMAAAVMRDPETALEVHAREELGVDPRALGSPIKAAAASFGSFALGALLPLLPWFFGSGRGAVIASLVLGFAGATAVGVGLAGFTGRSRVRSGARQLLIAVIAAVVTYGVGHLVGVSAP